MSNRDSMDLSTLWRWLVGDPDDLVRESRVAAIRTLLQRHATENRLRVLHPSSDKREVYSTWELHRHRLQARSRKRR